MVRRGSWSRIGGAVAAVAFGALGLSAVGCGPSPAYEPEPRVPLTYAPMPPTSEALAEQQQAGADAQVADTQQGEVAIGADGDEYSDTDPSALTEFRPVLEGHGRWVDDPTYGTVWVPNESEVGSDFQPYVTAGHWTYSDSTSWVWVSDYEWGWAPFHYGRWVYLPGYGWSWIPGRRYAGAWVVWRTGPYGYDYVGWAPAPPDYYWYGGWAVGWSFGWYYPHYVYCHHHYIYSPVVRTYVVHGGTPAAAPIEARTQPYQPAAPGVGRVPAAPSVGGTGTGRIAASPSVAGAGGRAIATPGVGPKPSDLGIKGESVPAPPPNHKGLERAQALASPRSAIAMGAAPPASPSAISRPRRIEPDAVAGAPPRAQGAPRPMSPSVQNRLEAAARAPQVTGVPPRQSTLPPVPRSPSSVTAPPRVSSPPLVSPEPLVPRFDTPSHVSPSPPSPPRFSSPSVPRSSPSFGGGSSPSPPPPSFRSAPSSPPSFRPSPSVTPHVSTPSHSSTPSRSAPSTSVGRGVGGRRGR